jgi:hypothetical protein
MGGTGKSTLALEYVYQHALPNYNAVFWMNAQSYNSLNSEALKVLERLVNSYAEKSRGRPDFIKIATDIGSPGKIDSSGKILPEAVRVAWEIVCN